MIETVKPSYQRRRSIGTILEVSGAEQNSSRAGKRLSGLDNATLTRHVTFSEEQPTRRRSSSLSQTLSTRGKRVFSPLCCLSTMSIYSIDRGRERSNTVSSSRIPLLSEVSANNNESNSPTVPISPARQSSSSSMQHNRISAHFDDTGKSYVLAHS